METPRIEDRQFHLGQELNYNGTLVSIVGFDAVGNPVVESKPQQVTHPEMVQQKDWTDVKSGLGAVSVKSTPLYCR